MRVRRATGVAPEVPSTGVHHPISSGDPPRAPCRAADARLRPQRGRLRGAGRPPGRRRLAGHHRRLGRRRGARQHLRIRGEGEAGLDRDAARRGRHRRQGGRDRLHGRAVRPELADSLPEAAAVLGFDHYPDIAARLDAIAGRRDGRVAHAARPPHAAAADAGRPAARARCRCPATPDDRRRRHARRTCAACSASG